MMSRFAIFLPPLAVLLLVAGVAPQRAQSHGQGMTLSKVTEQGLLVDIDYSDLQIEAETFGRFDISLFSDPDRTQSAEFTDLWVRIVQDDGGRVGKTLFAGAIAKQEFGKDGLLFVFPKGGAYTLYVRYNDANKGGFGETVAEVEFPLEVLRSQNENAFDFGSFEFWVGLIGGLFVALLVLLPLLMRKKS
jgi:hypothetical protein